MKIEVMVRTLEEEEEEDPLRVRTTREGDRWLRRQDT